jgi:hypothetical protein
MYQTPNTFSDPELHELDQDHGQMQPPRDRDDFDVLARFRFRRGAHPQEG